MTSCSTNSACRCFGRATPDLLSFMPLVGTDMLHIDCRLPDDPDEEAELIAAAGLVAPGDMVALFRMNYLRREMQDDQRANHGVAARTRI
jgi:hypothetical protein